MTEETLERLAHSSDRAALEAEAVDGRSYPIRLGAQARLSTLIERQENNRDRLLAWKHEVQAALDGIEAHARAEFSLLGNTREWVEARVGMSTSRRRLAINSLVSRHPDIKLLTGLLHTTDSEEQPRRWRNIRHQLEVRTQALTPQRQTRRKNVVSDGVGAFDTEAFTAYIKAAVDAHCDRETEQVTVKYVEHARLGLEAELQRIEQQLEAVPYHVAWDQPQWEQQSLDSAVGAACEHIGQAAPVFLNGSQFRDHVMYVESKPRRVHRRVGTARLDFINIRDEWRRLALLYKLDRNTYPAFEQMMFSHVVFPTGSYNRNTVVKLFEQHIPGHSEAAEDWATNLENNAIKEHIGVKTEWIDEGDPVIGIFAEVDEAHDQSLRNTLYEAGGTIVDNKLELPVYRSWAKVVPGSAIEANIQTEHGTATLTYNPHGSVGMKEVTTHRHSLTFSPTADAIDALMTSRYRSLRFAALEHFIRITDQATGTQVIRCLMQFDAITRIHINELLESDNDTMVLNNDEFMHQKSTIEHATAQEVTAASWSEVSPGKWLPTDAHLAAQCRFNTVAQYTQRVQAFTDVLSQLSITVDAESTDTDSFEWALDDQYWTTNRRHHFDAHGWSAPLVVGRALYDGLIGQLENHAMMYDCRAHDILLACDGASFSHCVESHVDTVHIEQTAPLSERGIVRMHGEPAAIVASLSRLRLGELEERVPWGWVGERFSRGARTGRVTAVQHEYAIGERVVDLQPGVSIVHGLTGAKTPTDALARLDSMIRSGGIKSIAERRRMQLAMHTMSPLGDIASGIDAGVPCKIGMGPSYGKWVFFAMKPSVMTRRDAWFADRDFGGGRCRYDLYTRYAQRIGQDRIHGPASADARERHLREAHDRSHNEIWLKNEISWDEIDAVFVCDIDGLLESVKHRVEQWKADGDVPESLVVIPYPHRDEDNQVLTERMSTRARVRQGLKYQAPIVQVPQQHHVTPFDIHQCIAEYPTPDSFELTIHQWLEDNNITEEEQAAALSYGEPVPSPLSWGKSKKIVASDNLSATFEVNKKKVQFKSFDDDF